MESSSEDYEGRLSDPSTPGSPQAPFKPSFTIKVSDPVKDGTSVYYTVKSVQTNPDNEFSVTRTFNDLAWLHQSILSNANTDGIIMPPLPAEPATDPKEVESKSKEQMGNNSNILIADNFERQCKFFQKYLSGIASHPVLGNSDVLSDFLTKQDAPSSTLVKQSLFGKIYSTLSEARKIGHQDIDEFFQTERENLKSYIFHIKSVNQSFAKILNSEKRMISSYSGLATSINSISAFDLAQQDDESTFKKLISHISVTLEDLTHGLKVDFCNNENTLGFHLTLQMQYADALKEMLFRRICLLIDYEESNKAYEKAKPAKKDQAKCAKDQAEERLDNCTEMARKEIVSYNQQKLLSLQEGMALYAEAKVKTARDTYALLSKSLTAFKQMDF